MTYTVKQGESIKDVSMNATGTIINTDAILTANGIDSWTPVLKAGQVLVIPDTVTLDYNTLRSLTTYPASNNLNLNVLNAITLVFTTLANNWILRNGYWDDLGVWIDTKLWID